MAAAELKLIHSGKILKDAETIASCGIKENDFMVVMVSKPKAAPAPKPEKTSETKPTEAAAPASEAPATETPAPAAETTAPSPVAAAPTAAAPASASFPEEAVTNLTSMGFPEAEVRHCLRVAHGNPDIAVEFLTNGIPDGMADASALVNAASGSNPSAAAPAAAGPLQALRNHPQFNQLKRLVQTNPAALQQVLAQIGQQQPDLLAEINSNQSAFLEMMNEPVTDAPAAPANPAAGAGPAGLNALRDPQQMAQMIATLGDAELAQMAQMIGMSPEQLRAMAQHASAAGVGGGGGGETVLQLTTEEMAAVNRLADMGFDRTEAAQAFLACDRNEALAANLLMDSMGSGGMFGDGGNDGPGPSGGNADDDDNMYD